MRILAGLLALCLLVSCGRGVPPGAPVVVAGDSVMAWNRIAGDSVADHLSGSLGVAVGDVSLPFATVTGAGWLGPLDIPTQTEGLRARWVVLNGGANDLRRGCGCTGCSDVLDRLLSEDGQSGAIADLVGGLRDGGSRVVWVDYYTAPVYAGTACTAPYDVLSARLSRMADADAGITVVDLRAAMPATNGALFAADGIHPSPEGSSRIAARVAERLRQVDDAFGGAGSASP